MDTKVLLNKDKKTNSEVYLLACDGDLSPQFVVRIPRDMLYDLGLSDDQWFDLLSDLMHLVQDFEIDNYLDNKKEYRWFSKFNITFRYIGED